MAVEKTQTDSLGRDLRSFAVPEADHDLGNPGSTEQPFLKNFPADFQYNVGLQ